MRTFLLLALLVVGVVFAAESDVKVLTDSTFDTETASGEWLLEFYAPWCGHCKNLAPKYEELATKVKDKYNVAKIDCTVEKTLQQRFGIRGFPTIKFLKDGQLYDYAGARTVDAFVTFMDGGYTSATVNPIPKAVPAAPAAATGKKATSDVIVLTSENFEAQTSKGTWFLEFYAPWCGHCKKLAPIYEEVATQLKGKVNVGKVNCEEEKAVCSQYGIRGYPTVYFKKDNELRDYTGQRNVDAFKKFADGEWKTVTPEAIPEPMSGWKLQAFTFLGALENGVGSNLWVIIGLCVIVGVVLGVIVVGCTSAPANKTIHYPAAPSSSSSSDPSQGESESYEPVEEVSKDD